MPVSPKYPGVYIEEIPSGVRTITGVSTATTAFVGRARKGPVNEPTIIHSFTEFERVFGGLWPDSTMSVAVNQYFANGGGEAVIVRVFAPLPLVVANFVQWNLPGLLGNLSIVAASPGSWARDPDNLHIKVDTNTKGPNLYNITVQRGPDPPAPAPPPPPLEVIRNVSLVAADPSFITTVLEQQSQYIRVGGGAMPTSLTPGTTGPVALSGNDGAGYSSATLVPATPADRVGIYALDEADIFNLLVIPPPTASTNVLAADWDKAATYCAKRRAMLLVDPPPAFVRPDQVAGNVPTVSSKKNAAFFYPRIKMQNPFNPDLIEEYLPGGAVAGIFARTDGDRGVWKAPAGLEATIAGSLGLSYTMTDDQNGDLNPIAVNCLRTFPFVGQVVWGSRTMEGADALASEWKYIPVRRLALYIEESLYRGLKWVVFEPNDEPLWSQIRLNAGAFMNNLFRQNAFQGRSPREAYFVKCDKDTTTQNDINLGIVNILIGFAPLKPAEFVIIKLQQMAGQIAV